MPTNRMSRSGATTSSMVWLVARRNSSAVGRAMTWRLRAFAHLDRYTDERAVLGPAAVVVADVGVAEQLRQHEPCVAGALADAAVDGHIAVGGHALCGVQVAQLVVRPECAVLG